MHVVVSVCVHQDDDLGVQESKRHHALFTVVLPRVLTRDGEVVSNCLGSLEVKTVRLNVAPTLGFVPGGHAYIVVTI